MHAPTQRAARSGRGQSCAPQPGQASPIKYCIYVIKENRTYDQVLGDLPQGQRRPDAVPLPGAGHAQPAPARARVRAAGQLLRRRRSQRATATNGAWAAYATDFVEKNVAASNYGHNRAKNSPYPARRACFPVADAGRRLPVGPRARGRRELPQLRRVRLFRQAPNAPWPHPRRGIARPLDPGYAGFDLAYPGCQTRRAVHRRTEALRGRRRHAAAADRAPAQRSHPRHHWPAAARPRPISATTTSRWARIVEAVSHSKFWPQTAIFVVEDDAQNGPDHVDAHRTPGVT